MSTSKVQAIKLLDGGVIQVSDLNGTITHYRQVASDGTDWSINDKYAVNLKPQ